MALDEHAVLATVTDALVDVVLVLDDDDTVRWQRRGGRLREAGPDPALGQPLLDRVHPEDLPAVLGALERLRSGDESRLQLSVRVRGTADASRLHDTDVLAIDARHVPGVEGIVVAARVLDTRAALSEEVHGDDFSLADAAPVGLAIVGSTGRLVFANERIREHLGLGARPAITATGVEGLHELVAATRSQGDAERILTHRQRTLRATGHRIGEAGGNVALSTADVTPEGRQLLEDHLRLAISRAGRRADLDDRAAVLVVVVGECGDEVRIELVRRLTEACRTTDVVALVEGDVVVVAEPGDAGADGNRLAERLRPILSEPVRGSSVAPAIGVATVSPDDTVESVLQRARESARGR